MAFPVKINGVDIKTGLLLAFLGIGSAIADDSRLATLQLRHRLAEEVAALIQPLLGPYEAVIPNRDQLILKASPARIEEIRALLDQLDRSPHRLLITVSQDSRLSREAAGAGVQGQFGTDTEIEGHVYQLQGQDAGGQTQQVQTLEGHSAMIQAGVDIPVPVYGYGGVGIDYRPVGTGFKVTPRLAGDQVILDIDPWSDHLSRDQGGVIDTQSAHTQIRATLGEWVDIGGVAESTRREHSGGIGHSYSTRSQNRRLFLKVEDLDAGRP